MIIKPNAIFIADVHFNKTRQEIISFLTDISTNKIKTEQLFLMGDIFDFLTAHIKYFITINQPLITLIQQLSTKIDIIYLEGNHDFLLSSIFKNIKVIPRNQQPLYIKQNNQTIALSHGDIYTPLGYNIYCKIFRNSLFQQLLNRFDFNNYLSKYFEKKLISKSICSKQQNFKSFISKRIDYYGCDIIIEGHYHQGYISSQYINIPSFHCDLRYLIYCDKKFTFVNYNSSISSDVISN